MPGDRPEEDSQPRRRPFRIACLSVGGVLVVVIAVLVYSFLSGLSKIPEPWTYPGPGGAKLGALLANAAVRCQPGNTLEARLAAEGLTALDPTNALPYYVKAAALAKEGDLDGATRALEEGNAAPDCYEYVTSTGYARLASAGPDPILTAVSELARACSPEEATDADPATIERANLALRDMAEKLFGSKPRNVLTALFGCGVRAAADKNLEALYLQQGDEAKLAHVRRDSAEFGKWSAQFGRASKAQIDKAFSRRNVLLLALARDKAADAAANAEAAVVEEYMQSWPRPGGDRPGARGEESEGPQ